MSDYLPQPFYVASEKTDFFKVTQLIRVEVIFPVFRIGFFSAFLPLELNYIKCAGLSALII